jgi:putative OPT family oligopeptide transporter
MAGASLQSEPLSTPIRELTVRGFVLGGALALILGAANAYLGLYAGMTVSASIPAAVISMAVLRMLGRATILENNVVQTIASAGEAVAAGAIFTFPALVILGSRELPYWEVTVLCLAGGTMGSLFVVFLRRAYIVDEALPFPEGRACAEVLRAGDEGGAGVGGLVLGAVCSALLKFLQDLLGIFPEAFAYSGWIGGSAITVSANLSGALIGVGYIVGLEIATLVFLGGAFNWFIAIPLVSRFHHELGGISAAAAAQRIWSNQTRYLGVGAMIVGGVATLWRLRGPILRGLADTSRILRSSRDQRQLVRREDTDLSARAVAGSVMLCIPAVFGIIFLISGQFWISAGLALVLVVVGFFAAAVAGYLSGIVGASNNPVSGVTIVVLLAIALILRFLHENAATGPGIAVLAGAVVCTAAAMAGDSTHDLATGFHVGATPWALEIAVLSGAIVSAFVMAPVLNLLIHGYGIAGLPGSGPHALSAPQAFLMAKVAQGVFSGDLPWITITFGALIAVVLLVVDRRLEARGARWRTPVMPVAIGLYLPLGLGMTVICGAIIRRLLSPDDVTGADPGLLAAAGLIAGEALAGVAVGAVVTTGAKLPLF